MQSVNLDSSLAFTALLNLSPEFGAMPVEQSLAFTKRLVADYRASKAINMYAYARLWLTFQPETAGK